ncbi:GGDEF domain-containing protein [Aminipila terrae]|uniref:Diguanylate cyclase n=1 Tax=Aminipila terrae TaxID=2697030 RepID=A0A6P1MGW3_9FIRM|nr:GGDEF domain-containing protein [Aminipila terrae]QHI71814.1 diguanylate cyclase [Aminipila terrae]
MTRNNIFIRNYHEISKINNNILKHLSFIVAIIWALLFIISSITSELLLVPFYGIGALISSVVYLLSRFITPKHINLVLPVIYFYLVYGFISAIYLGIFVPPRSVSVTFMCLLLMAPILILDKRWRINSIVIFMSVVFGTVSFLYQPFTIAEVDITNCIVFCIIGLIVGHIMASIRIENIEMQRILTKQRDTDILTSLSNRRKLSDTLDNWDANYGLHSLTVVIMIDIDYFKKYNDCYGHQKGDACLKQLGRCFSSFFKPYGLKIFRYGGEEFIALGQEYDFDEISLICQDILKAVKYLQIPFKESPEGIITVSIGFAESNTCNSYNYKDLINMADKGLYKAKRMGRNRAVGYLN